MYRAREKRCNKREMCCRDVADRDAVQQAVSGNDDAAGPNWNEDYPEDATAIVIHHTSILRNKRLLLAYQ